MIQYLPHQHKNLFASLSLIFCFLLSIHPQINAQTDQELNQKIKTLIAKMTLDEKIGQTALRGRSSRDRGGLSEELKQSVRNGEIGAFLNVMDKEMLTELQRIAVEESPQGIPLIFARDVIHGFKTIFPIPLGIAASWDPEVAKTTARISAVEASGSGIRWTFAPMLDIARDSRWGRVAESPGEDPYLAALLAKAYVAGFQGKDLTDPTNMAACAKHFLAYGAAIGGRDYNTVSMHEPLLRNVYLPPFQAAIESGALTVMTAFNEINGVPASGNEFLLKDVLRDEMAFDGFVVSDWDSVTEMIPHGFAKDEKHAAALAAKVGLDMEMTSRAYEHHLKTLLQEGKITIETIDFLVENILRVKFKLGLFQQAYIPKNQKAKLYHPDHLAAAKKAAIQSMVLLKNNNTLPLKETQTLAIIGPLADAPHDQLGTWTFDGEKEKTITPLKSFKASQATINYAQGLSYSRDTSTAGFAEAIAAAKNSDVILFFGGEEAILSGEAHSRADISLPGKQEALLHELATTGKPIVLVILAGRPISIPRILDKVDAVLMAWHPGTMGGPALEEVLNGKANPGGRLPITWPKSGAQLPLFYNHKNTGRPADSSSFVQLDNIPIGAWQSSLGNDSHYLDLGFTPQFPFGYGLSYTNFSYRNLRLSKKQIGLKEPLTIEATIKNTGNRKATEIVQLYVQDVVGSITRPIRELKAFQAIELAAGEEKTVRFILHPEQLKFVNHRLKEVIESGDFNVWVGPNAAQGLKGAFELK